MMLGISNSYKVLSPVTKVADKKVSLAAPIPDLSGKTICAMRHTFRRMRHSRCWPELFREKYSNIRFIPIRRCLIQRPASPEEAERFDRVLKDKGCDVLLTGNGA